MQWGRYCSKQLFPESRHFSVIFSVSLWLKTETQFSCSLSEDRQMRDNYWNLMTHLPTVIGYGTRQKGAKARAHGPSPKIAWPQATNIELPSIFHHDKWIIKERHLVGIARTRHPSTNCCILSKEIWEIKCSLSTQRQILHFDPSLDSQAVKKRVTQVALVVSQWVLDVSIYGNGWYYRSSSLESLQLVICPGLGSSTAFLAMEIFGDLLHRFTLVSQTKYSTWLR